MLAGAEITAEARAAADRLMQARRRRNDWRVAWLRKAARKRRSARRLKLTTAQAKVELTSGCRSKSRTHNERYYQNDAPTISDAAYDALRQRLRGDRGAVSRPRDRGIAVAEGRRGAGARLREGAACRADAVARQCLQRRGRRRIRRARPALPQARCRAYSGARRRAEDRRPVAVAALRERRTGARARRAATALPARTSPPMSAPSRTFRRR